MKFAHLHVHSVYSLKDSIARPEDYVRRIHEYNKEQSNHEITALAITEHGNMFSLVNHHEACVKKNQDGKTVKPIYGCEVYHVGSLDNIKDKFKVEYNEINHLVLLAKNNKGLENLYKITSHAGSNKLQTSKNSKEYMTTDLDFILQHGEGLIGTSACIGGLLAKMIISGEYKQAKALARTLNKLLDEFYLEIQPHDTLPEQVLVNEALIKMSRETGLKLIITTDSHFVYEEERKYHDLLKEINFASKFTTKAHLWTVDELIDWCNINGVPLSAIENTALLAERCTADITPQDKQGLMPDFPCPDGHNEESYLIKIANEGLKHRFETNKDILNTNEYVKRLNYELDIITQMGFSGYFLILWDWFKWCKANKIPLGPGRGSAGGSLVAYCLDVTKMDPIKNELVFERFLNPSRLDDPDIDSDVSKTHRAEAIKYLLKKYGESYVCQIATFGEYKLKNTIKAVLSADRGFDAEFQNGITKQIPSKLGDLDISYHVIEDIVNNPDDYITTEKISDREYTEAVSCYNMLQDLFEEHPEVKDAIEHLRGSIASVGIHAGGVVISRKPLSSNVPLMTGSDTAILPVSQINMDGMHFFRGLKIDVLGLKTLSQIRLCMDLADIKEEWYDDENAVDPYIYEFLMKGNTTNIFQMSKHVPTKMIKDFRVKSLAGMIDVNAGNRPGPQKKGEDGKSLVDKYIEVVKTGIIPKIHPKIDPILLPTNGQLW